MFEIIEWHFKAQKSIGLVIYARAKETALKMAETINLRHNNLPPYTLSYWKKIFTSEQPYVLEQSCWEYVRNYERKI